MEVEDIAKSRSSFVRFDDAETLRKQFRELDPETLEALVVARRLHQLNLALTLRRPGLDLVVARANKLIGEDGVK